MKMTKKELTEVLEGIINQLDYNDKKEFIENALDIMTVKQKKELLSYCKNVFPTDTRISLEENGVIASE